MVVAGVLYHLSDMLVGLHALRRLLKPNGTLLVETAAIDDPQRSYADFARFVGGARLHELCGSRDPLLHRGTLLGARCKGKRRRSTLSAWPQLALRIDSRRTLAIDGSRPDRWRTQAGAEIALQ